MHITYELKRVSKQIRNKEACDKLRENASTREIKQAATRDTNQYLAELTQEQTFIESAAAKFGVFLSKNSLTAYNHSREEYLQFQINEEKKFPPDQRDENLIQSLEKSLASYRHEVDALNTAIASGDNSLEHDVDMIYTLIQKLYTLKHTGRTIKNFGTVDFTVTKRTRREESHRFPEISAKRRYYPTKLASIMSSVGRRAKNGCRKIGRRAANAIPSLPSLSDLGMSLPPPPYVCASSQQV